MSRFTLGLAALALVASAAPARALEPPTTGSIILATATPAPTKELFNRGVTTNLLGWVVALPPSADGASYSLKRTSGVGNLDAFFFEDDGGDIGQICSLVASTDDHPVFFTEETGTICPGPQQARWAILVLKWGANAGFSFTT